MDGAPVDSLVYRLFGPQSDPQLEQIETLPATPEEFRQRLRESVRHDPEVLARVREKAIDACRRRWEPLIVDLEDWRIKWLGKRKRRLAAKAEKASQAARQIMHKQIAMLLSPYGGSLLLEILDEAILSTDVPALEFPAAAPPVVSVVTADVGMNPKAIREFWLQHAITKKRKRRAESKHAKWERQWRELCLTHKQIAELHERETGESVTPDAVKKGINRLLKSQPGWGQ